MAPSYGQRLAQRYAVGLGDDARRSDNDRGIYGWGATMSRLSMVVGLSFVLVLPLALGGCVGVVIAGGVAAAGGAGYSAAQERGVSTSATDFTLETDIEADCLKAGPELQSGAPAPGHCRPVLFAGRRAAPGI